jgi:autotransporter-associated beta strand protein
MELLKAIDLQFNSKPIMEAWLGNTFLWGRGVIWTGLGSDNNWSTTANWYKSTVPPTFASIQFTGTNRLTANNDFSIDRPVNNITFNPSAGSFTLSGNRFILNSGTITNNSINTQTINSDIKLGTGVNYINSNTGNMTFNGLLSGNASISKTGSGQVNLSVARSIFTGSVTVSGGTLQFDNLTTNGGGDLSGPSPTVYNLNDNGASLNLNTGIFGSGNRILFIGKTINFSSLGNQTVSLTGNVLFNTSTFKTNGGAKNYISGPPIPGSNYFNAQFSTITYNIADGIDDVDLEVSANMHFQAPVKTGAGKLSIVAPYNTNMSGPLTISAGTFDVGGSCSIPVDFSGGPNTILNNGTFSYSSSINSNCSNYTINGTGNLIKSGTSILTLSSSRCTYAGFTLITTGSIIITKDTATATLTPTTLTVTFSTPPNIGDSFKFFTGSTVQTYASVSLIGAPGRTASYDSPTSTLSIIS